MPRRPRDNDFPLSLKPLTRQSAELRAKILSLLKNGASEHQVARQLKISLGTVGYHVPRLRMAGDFEGG
jgi:DNA-binding NarL/FixJ family response regulator